MSHLLHYYQRPEPATWVFLSSFLLLGIYFVFHRFFSVRNLDILLLLALAPGLMMVYEGRRMQLAGQTETIATEELATQHSPIAGLPLADAQPSRVHPVSIAQPVSIVHPVSTAQPVSIAQAAPQQQQPAAVAQRAAVSGGEGPVFLDNESPSNYPQPSTSPNKWSAEGLEFAGFAALLLACLLLMIRMLIDPALVRRPLLVPNLSIGGLSFIGGSLFLFLMANVITSTPREQHERGPRLGPGYALLNMLPELPTTPDKVAVEKFDGAAQSSAPWLPNVARILAILSNLAILLGIVGVGYWHFDNVKTGIGCAVMYLLLPYTAQMTGNLEHIVPAALLVLALLAYRQPVLSGILLGLAAGLVYYPLFLLPLWISFYWHRGLKRLLIGVSSSLVMLSGLLLLEGAEAFGDHLRWMYGMWLPRMDGLEGIWGPGRIPPDFRLPVLVAFILLSCSFVFWPSRKNLGTLICGTAAIMLAAQFWHGNGGGLFMAWFLPFVMLTIFRPNLDDRIATHVVRLPRAKPKPAA
ncbi:MAG: hypothetical protein KDA45_01510 [Planctomycetales bacterium]|nr:hypothetical protein [Planctomycetales bacterium]